MPNAPIIPPPLPMDGTAYVLQAAGKADPDELERGASRLRERGLRTRAVPLTPDPGGYLAGTDRERVADAYRAFSEDDVDVVWCARGGYGAMRLLERLPPDLLARSPRWLVGYSDITALHLWAHRQGVATVHGPMVAGLGRESTDGSAAEGALRIMRERRGPRFEALRGLSGGRGVGVLIGGNLSLLAALVGTRLLPALHDTILFVEEVGEPLYRIDRCLTTLLLWGRRVGLRGIAFGQFTRCDLGPLQGEAFEEWLAERVAVAGVPVVSGVPCGHVDDARSLLLGVPYEIDGDAGVLVPRPITPPRRSAARAGDGAERRAERVSRAAPVGGAVELLSEAIRTGAFCAGQLAVWCDGEVTHSVGLGVTGVTSDAVVRAVSPRTRFDLASITKAVATGILSMRAVEDGRVELDTPAPYDMTEARVSLRDLLRHASGLPAYERVFQAARVASDPLAFALRRFREMEPEEAWVGRHRYSDVGFVLLGRWLERLYGVSLSEAFDKYVASPLGLRRTGFMPVDEGADTPDSTWPRSAFAATEWCPYRGRTLQGVVHDENCQVLGGAAGHAGLFGTAGELVLVAASLLGDGPPLLAAETVDQMWDREQIAPGGGKVLGWDTPTGPRSTAGALLSRKETFGHLGFTGTSLWIDRARRLAIALLTNRVHPTRDNARHVPWRPAIHDAVVRELGLEEIPEVDR